MFWCLTASVGACVAVHACVCVSIACIERAWEDMEVSPANGSIFNKETLTPLSRTITQTQIHPRGVSISRRPAFLES